MEADYSRKIRYKTPKKVFNEMEDAVPTIGTLYLMYLILLLWIGSYTHDLTNYMLFFWLLFFGAIHTRKVTLYLQEYYGGKK